MSESFGDYGIYLPGGATGEIDVLCPQCSDSRKKSKERCLSVNVAEGTWLCHHCSWSGGLKRADLWKGHQKPPKKYAKPSYTYPKIGPTGCVGLPHDVVLWFAKRGISEDTLQQEKIGYENGWIKFPYFRNGECINIKSRKLAEKEFYQEKDAEKILYGMTPLSMEDSEKAERTLVWVEGEMDRLSMLEAGYKYVVSVPDGAPTPGAKNTHVKFDYLENCEGYIKLFTEHIIAVDTDRPGQFLRDELARRLGVEKCKRMDWPQSCKDANEALVAGGVRAVREAMTTARFFPVEGVFEINDVLPDAFRMYDEGVTRGCPTGWPALDRYLTIRPGELCILTGIPSSGKSSWLDALIVNLARNDGFKTGIFSPENAPLAQHFKKLAEIYVGKPFLPGTSSRMSTDEVLEAADFMQEHFYFISPLDNAMTIDEILDKAKVLVFRHGINFLIIDPYNDIDHGQFDGMAETAYISRFLSKCQRFARLHQVFVCLVAHPTKLQKDPKTGNYPVPTPYDIAGSAHFRNRGDVCLSGHRPDLTQDVFELHVQKVRFKEVGKPGMVKMLYDQASGRFEDAVMLAPARTKERATARARDAETANRELAAAQAAFEQERQEGLFCEGD